MAKRPQSSPLREDPDARLVRCGWLAWTVTSMLLVWLVWLGWREGAPGWVVLGAPALALWLLWPLWRGARAGWHWTRARPYVEWQGSYFEFDGRQIRVLFESDDVWIAADDVFDALGLTGRARDAERVRRIAGRDGLVNAPGTTLPAFTERGLAAWMERRTDRAAADFKRWFDTQVIAPYRRKRARIGEANIPPAINSTR